VFNAHVAARSPSAPWPRWAPRRGSRRRHYAGVKTRRPGSHGQVLPPRCPPRWHGNPRGRARQ